MLFYPQSLLISSALQYIPGYNLIHSFIHIDVRGGLGNLTQHTYIYGPHCPFYQDSRYLSCNSLNHPEQTTKSLMFFLFIVFWFLSSNMRMNKQSNSIGNWINSSEDNFLSMYVYLKALGHTLKKI